MRPEVIKFRQEMEEKFGKNVLRQASELTNLLEVRIPTGSIALDIACGGGVPLGRFIQICGALSSCKSSLCYHIIKNVQQMTKTVTVPKKKGKEIIFDEIEAQMEAMLIQAEANSWTNEYGEQIGIDIDRLLINECAGMEEGLEIAHKAQKRTIADLILIDSLEALTPTKEYDSDMADNIQMGIKQKLFGEYFRKFQATNNLLSREEKLPCTVIGINQLREKIGTLYGDPEYAPGGRAIGFAASLDIRLRKGEYITVGTGVNKRIIGQRVKFKIYKNKVGIPQRTGEFDFYFDEGGVVSPGYIDNYKEIIIEGLAYGIIHKKGTWYSYGNIREQGTAALIETLRSDDDVIEELKQKLYEVALDKDADRNTDYDPEVEPEGDEDDEEDE
jgi:recombination protein RecA